MISIRRFPPLFLVAQKGEGGGGGFISDGWSRMGIYVIIIKLMSNCRFGVQTNIDYGSLKHLEKYFGKLNTAVVLQVTRGQ